MQIGELVLGVSWCGVTHLGRLLILDCLSRGLLIERRGRLAGPGAGASVRVKE